MASKGLKEIGLNFSPQKDGVAASHRLCVSIVSARQPNILGIIESFLNTVISPWAAIQIRSDQIN